MKLRKYQEACLEKILKSVKDGNKKILAVLPTGAGKTLIETRLTDCLSENLGAFDCIVHLCHLSDITFKNADYYREHGRHSEKVFVMHGPTMPAYGRRILFTTMQTMCREKRIKSWKAMAFARSPKFFIIDEAHLYGCSSYDKILAEFPDAILIGFTATPFRANYPALMLFQDVAYTVDMETLIAEGHLTKPTMHEFHLPDKTDSTRITAVYKVWREQESDRGLPGLLVCPTISQAQQACAVLTTAQMRTAYFDGKTPQKEVDETLQSVRAGKVDILIVCKKGQLGMDIPNLAFVLLPWGVKSVVTFLQVVGRVVRIFEGKEGANIYLWGDTPAVKKGHYRRMLSYALKLKEDPEGPGASLKEELEYLEFHEEPNYERITWTKEAIESCQILAAGNVGLPAIAKLSERKQFPKKYANALRRITETMAKAGKAAIDPDLPTPVQRRILDEYKFDTASIDTLNKGECSALIAGMKRFHTRSPFTIPRGPYAGRHFSETPSMYRAKLKDPVVKSLFYRWIKAGRPADEEIINK